MTLPAPIRSNLQYRSELQPVQAGRQVTPGNTSVPHPGRQHSLCTAAAQHHRRRGIGEGGETETCRRPGQDTVAANRQKRGSFRYMTSLTTNQAADLSRSVFEFQRHAAMFVCVASHHGHAEGGM
jgi:hypothetical protein